MVPHGVFYCDLLSVQSMMVLQLSPAICSHWLLLASVLVAKQAAMLLQDCTMDDDCTVATYVVTGDGDFCTLKKCGAVELESPVVVEEDTQSFKFCTGMHFSSTEPEIFSSI